MSGYNGRENDPEGPDADTLPLTALLTGSDGDERGIVGHGRDHYVSQGTVSIEDAQRHLQMGAYAQQPEDEFAQQQDAHAGGISLQDLAGANIHGSMYSGGELQLPQDYGAELNTMHDRPAGLDSQQQPDSLPNEHVQANEALLMGSQPYVPPQQTKSSRYRGVCRRKGSSRWESSIIVDGRSCRLENFDTEEEAARAYDRAAIVKWGTHAAAQRVNFPITDYDADKLVAADHIDLLVQQQRGHHVAGDGSYSVSIAPTGLEALAAPEDPDAEPSAKRPRHNPPFERVVINHSSQYRGVTMQKSSGRWLSQVKWEGKPVYLGSYASEETAAAAYDMAIILLQGEGGHTNFPPQRYAGQWDHLRSGISLQDLRTQLKKDRSLLGLEPAPPPPAAPASMDKPGPSKFRGVARVKSRWRAQICISSKQTIYLGLHDSEEDAARTHDRAAICRRRADDARTNFPLKDYEAEIKALEAADWSQLLPRLRNGELRHGYDGANRAQQTPEAATDNFAAPAAGAAAPAAGIGANG